MLRRLKMSSERAMGCDWAQPLARLDVPGFAVCETLYEPAQEIPVQSHTSAVLCLTVDGGYEVDWLRKRMHCGPAALVFHPPGQVYGARISDVGSRPLLIAITLRGTWETRTRRARTEYALTAFLKGERRHDTDFASHTGRALAGRDAQLHA